MRVWVVVLALVVATGCAAKPAPEVVPHFHPAIAIEPLIAFQAATLVQFEQGGLEPEHLAAITFWVSTGISVLRGTHPGEWEAVARAAWPHVRSIIGPYPSLTVWASVFDSLLQ